MNTFQVISAVSIHNIDNLLAEWAIKIAIAVAIFFVGKWVAQFARGVFTKFSEKKQIDASLSRFVASLLYYLILAFVVVAALGQLGINTTSMVAILGAAGLAIGLALQGCLANFASGVMILLFRPFKTGDVIDGGGVVGIVEGIDILTTEIKSFDGKKMIVPNGKFLDGVITNINAYPMRRVDIEFSISYDDDVDQARAIVMEILKADERIKDDPAIMIALMNYGDSSLDMVARAWVDTPNWWPVLSENREKVKKAFDSNGITIPFPQREIRIVKENDSAS